MVGYNGTAVTMIAMGTETKVTNVTPVTMLWQRK